MKKSALNLQAHKQVLDSIRRHDWQTVADGPVIAVRYEVAEPRLLWVLRETHGGGPWDLREFLRDKDKLFSYRHWHCTYGALAKISYGVMNCLHVEDVKSLGARSAVDAIRDVAVINVNKRGGEGRVAWDKLIACAQEFSPFVSLQIEALDPEIIIAAGTAHLLPKEFRAPTVSLPDRPIAAAKLTRNSWLVKCYHTGQTQVPQHILYGRILEELTAAGWSMHNGHKNARGG